MAQRAPYEPALIHCPICSEYFTTTPGTRWRFGPVRLHFEPRKCNCVVDYQWMSRRRANRKSGIITPRTTYESYWPEPHRCQLGRKCPTHRFCAPIDTHWRHVLLINRFGRRNRSIHPTPESSGIAGKSGNRSARTTAPRRIVWAERAKLPEESAENKPRLCTGRATTAIRVPTGRPMRGEDQTTTHT